MSVAPLAIKTLELIERVEAGDREAAFDLAQLYKPDSVRDFVEFVATNGAVTAGMFDVLADAYDWYAGGVG